MISLRRLLIGVATYALFAFPSLALDENLNRATTALGQVNAWRWTPEVLLRHCRIHVPVKAGEMQEAHDHWQIRNAALVSEIEDLTDTSVPVFAKLLGMTPEQTRAWQKDSAALGIEELAFWRKGRVEVVTMCGNFPQFLLDMERDVQIDAIRTRLQIARSALMRHAQ